MANAKKKDDLSQVKTPSNDKGKFWVIIELIKGRLETFMNMIF